jgi:ketosteroid isomerase-like protein
VVVPDVAVRASVAAAGASTLARGALAEVTRAARIGELDSALRMRDRPVVVDARTRAEVGATVGRFARALEARDLDALRRVYPGLSTTERSTWAAFFRNASSIRARFATQDAQIADGGIDVTVLGSLQFTKRDTREPVDQAVTFRALVRHADGGWTIRTLQ